MLKSESCIEIIGLLSNINICLHDWFSAASFGWLVVCSLVFGYNLMMLSNHLECDMSYFAGTGK